GGEGEASEEEKEWEGEGVTELSKEGERFTALATESLDRMRETTRAGFHTQGELKEAETKLSEARMSAAERRASLVEAESAARAGRIALLAAQQALLNLGVPARAEDYAAIAEDARAEKIRLLGIPESVAATLDPRTASANLLAVVAPFDGVVVARDVGAGESVEPS